MRREREKMAALGGGRDGRQLCSVLCNLEALCSARESSRAEPSCSVPGQDLSLLPTSSPHAAAKPALGMGLNFWFWPSSVPRPVSLCYTNRKSSTQRRQRKERRGWGRALKGDGRIEESVPSPDGFRVLLLTMCGIKTARQSKKH